MYVFFLREKSYTFFHASLITPRRWLLNKQFAAAGRASMPRTPKKTPAMETTPQTIDWSLQGDKDTNAKTVTPKMNSGAVTGKVVVSNKSADDKIEGSKPSLSTPMLPATWLLQGKRHRASTPTWPNLVRGQMCQVEARTFSVFPDSQGLSRKLRFLDRPIVKTDFPQ